MIWEHAAYPRGKVQLDDHFIFENGNAVVNPYLLKKAAFFWITSRDWLCTYDDLFDENRLEVTALSRMSLKATSRMGGQVVLECWKKDGAAV